ncbi:glycoside hydrolase family 18 protein [Calycina marina]|uniref:chitinase n=1 Tax=Calycina marina TaxID=1763456 RepID=A0A9P8CDR5_9HELO|nr:glycoside hydrolase family 18 protein [Calycina marina]
MRFLAGLSLLTSISISCIPAQANQQPGLLGVSLSLQNAFIDLLPEQPTIPPPPAPSPRLVIYVQTFTDTAGRRLSLLPLLEHDTKVTHVILGSVHLHEKPGVIMLNNEPLSSDIHDYVWREVKILQEHGVKVLALLGGAAPGTYSRLSADDAEFEGYYRPLVNLIKTYRLDGLDVDIEEKVPLSTPIRLLRRLAADLGPSFLLTMAPLATALSDEKGDDLSGFSYQALDRLATIPSITTTSLSTNAGTSNDTKLISWYNAQFYGGYSRSTYMYDSIVYAGIDPSRLVMGVTTSAAGYPNGFTPLKKLLGTVRELKEKYGNSFGGVSGWEYWDAGSGDRDMGMQVGGEPWRWLQRVAKAVHGAEDEVRGRGRKSMAFNGECLRKCIRGNQ